MIQAQIEKLGIRQPVLRGVGGGGAGEVI